MKVGIVGNMSKLEEKLITCFYKWLENNNTSDSVVVDFVKFLYEEDLLDENKVKNYVKTAEDRIIEEVLYKFDAYCYRQEELHSNVKTKTIRFNDESYVILEDDFNIISGLHQILKGEELCQD